MRHRTPRSSVLLASLVCSASFACESPAPEVVPDARAVTQQEPAGEEGPAAPDEPSPERSRAPLPTVAEVTKDAERRAGLFPIHLDRRAGKLWLALPATGPGGVLAECLVVEGLTQGLGSNEVGLDRGQLGAAALVRFRRLGPKVLLEQQNLAYRASSSEPEERRAAAESFATSVLWGTEVAAEDPDGELLIDLTSFLVRDAHGVARKLEAARQGHFTLDAARSAPDLDACLAFPDNLELEALLTFGSSDPGPLVRETAPDASSVTLVQHHSFVRLPDTGFEPRAWDPRSGAQPLLHLDYSAPLERPVERRLALRHRLIPADPLAPRSAAREPLVYYVDRAAPEPVRGALLEGARWWAEAFSAAGFEDAFRVELLPEGAHPLDVRYNVIQWVHRSTRGWSYGNAVVDPRTGEILKGHVSLGSLRVRQDRLLLEGLLGAERSGSGAPDDPVQLALARIRQLAAHEVGHTLGFEHNFSASACGRASVMDYPAPLVRVTDGGELDVSDAYAVGIGEWDVAAVRWLYGARAGGDDGEAVLAGARARGLRYHSDEDARPAGAAQPIANLWDNFADPVTGLENALDVRRVALARFGQRCLAASEPRARLEEVLAPLYFHHRYQVEAAAKALGGVDYDHARNDQIAEAAPPVPAELQRRALASLLLGLEPAALDLPEPLLRALAPRAPGLGGRAELFAGEAGVVFDPLAAAASAAGLVVEGLLQPERCLRLVDQHRRDAELPSLEEVLERLTDAAFDRPPPATEREAELSRAVQAVVVRGLVRLAGGGAPLAVRARVEARLRRLIDEPWAVREETEAEFAHARALVGEVLRFLERRGPPEGTPGPPLAPPPGSPIGSEDGAPGCSRG